MIDIEEFAKVEIQVGTLLSVEKAEGADKLLRLVFDFGPMPEEDTSGLTRIPELLEKYPGRDIRQIMSAIAPFFEDPQILVEKQICVVTNLEPRVFRGYESQGMILAVDNPEGGIVLIGPESKVPAGTKIH